MCIHDDQSVSLVSPCFLLQSFDSTKVWTTYPRGLSSSSSSSPVPHFRDVTDHLHSPVPPSTLHSSPATEYDIRLLPGPPPWSVPDPEPQSVPDPEP